MIVTQSSTSSSYLNQQTFPSYNGGCSAVIDKLSVSGVPIPEGNWYPVVVEVVVLVSGSIPERVQHTNMDDWRMDCPWWLVLTVIPVSGLCKPLYCYRISAIRYLQEGLEPKWVTACVERSIGVTKSNTRGGGSRPADFKLSATPRKHRCPEKKTHIYIYINK